jgi:alkanesulfonate monooxygenase SsuD/methylene tetrahydromethanopterin reductase-like flavin-dependent oxidoreductase (luciferase family)
MTQSAPRSASAAPGPMRISIFSVQDHHPRFARTVPQLYEEVAVQCALAETLGYDTFLVAEHHFHEYGSVPNPAVYLAMLAERCKKIRLGPGISILTFHHPLTVAESWAMVDVISGGRLTLGVGSGYLKHEFAGYAVDPAQKRERFDENLAILKLALAGECFSYAGKYTSVDQVQLQVRPLQQPLPPIYSAVLAKEAAYYVGSQGNNMLCVPYASVDNFAQIRELVDGHKRGFAEFATATPAPRGGDVFVCLHAHCAPTDAECRKRAADPFDLYVETRLYAKRQTYNDIMRSGLALFGTPEAMVQKMVELYDMGIEHVALLQNFGYMPPENVHDSMRLFANDVLPRVNRILSTRGASKQAA